MGTAGGKGCPQGPLGRAWAPWPAPDGPRLLLKRALPTGRSSQLMCCMQGGNVAGAPPELSSKAEPPQGNGAISCGRWAYTLPTAMLARQA